MNRREAFLGTPPAYDTPRLMDFYQQIEDANRLSLHRINTLMVAFVQAHGNHPEHYDVETNKKYKDLLEDQSRAAIDIAMAGLHCGARYMGESMSVYYELYGDDQKLEGSLLDYSIELLAQKRRKIAEGEVTRRFGSDTHSYNKYFATMGPLLKIPGTKNIIEYLDNSVFDISAHLTSFCKLYTVDTIIDTIQDEIKTSGIFRDKVIDWIRDQVKDWKEKEYRQIAQDTVHVIQGIIQENVVEKPAAILHLEIFQELISTFKERQIPLPAIENGWDNFIQELFATDEAKNFLKGRLPPPAPNLTLIKIRAYYLQNTQAIKTTCSEAYLGLEFLDHLKEAVFHGTPLQADSIHQKFLARHKVEKIHQAIRINKETLLRVIEGGVNVEGATRAHLDQVRRLEFIENLKLEKMTEEGLPPEILEWFLVSHHILLPQMEG